MSRYTFDEEVSIMTLWIVARSPLMFGGDLRTLATLDPAAVGLITNLDALGVQADIRGSRELTRNGSLIIWLGESATRGNATRYCAIFNTGERPAERISIAFERLGLPGTVYATTDLWSGRVEQRQRSVSVAAIPRHGAVLLRIEPDSARRVA